MARTLTVEIIGDARSLNRALASTESTTKGLGKRFGNLGKTAGLAAGAAGVGGLIFALKTGIGEFKQSQEVAAQTNAVIKSTGKVANVSAKEVDDLATSIMKKSGFDDEAVKSGENLLLTFTNVRNEVGKGNKIFDQATRLTADLSVAFHKDLNQSAVLVGKALNDPVKGLTALGRVGVQFSEGQKKVIKNLVDTGHTLEAQKMIIGEVNKQVGGSAEAYGKTLPGQIAIARESFNNFAGDLVAKAIPAITNMVNYIRDHWPQISKVIKTAWEQNIKPALTALIALVVEVVKTIRKHWGTIGPIVNAAVAVIRTAVNQITAILRLVTALLRGDWTEAWKQLKTIASNAFKLLKQYLTLEKDVVVALLKGIGTAIMRGLSAGITAGLDLVKKAVTGLFGKVIGWAKGALGIGSPSKVFHEIGQNAIQGFINGVGSMAGALKSAAVGAAKSAATHLGGIIPGFGGPGKVARGKGGSTLGTLVPWANSEGLTVTSTTGGTHVAGSYHYKGRAVDVAGSAGQMRKFFFDSLAHFGVGQIKELFYDPVGEYVKNGRIVRGAIGGHSDHVHLALAKGGIVTRPTMAMIGEAGPEAVIPLGRGGGQSIQLVLPDGRMVAEWLIDPLRSAAQVRAQRTGRAVFG